MANGLIDRNEILSRSIARGLNPPGLTAFRREYVASMTTLKKKAEKRLGASLAKSARSQVTCWKLLNRLRNPSTAVAIDADTLTEHFEGIFYDAHEPFLFDLSALGIPCPIDFCPNQFTDSELLLALRELNAQAAVGPQRISSSYIKQVFINDESRVPLLVLMNRCFFEGKVPAAWGYSEVFVLYKGKGDKKLSVNYRGINLNDDFLRLFERLLDKRLVSWLSCYQPWGDQQFGFCSGVGTEDAALCLQSLAGVCTRAKGFPLFANFIDLQRAFPSMLRSQILRVLHEIGVPFELVRAFAATFSGNSCRLKIGDLLTRAFISNRGTKEGGINSPKIFNTVYATALKKLNVSEFPTSVDDVVQSDVYYLVFADDLVLLSGNLTRLEDVSNQLSLVLEPLGMKLNSGKTKWMAFLPERVHHNVANHHTFSLQIDGTYLENVDRFDYLGFTMSWDLSKSVHQKRREQLQTIAARSVGRVLKSLEVTNFRSLRSYYMALVRSQLYSLSFSVFSEEEFNRAQKVFLQNVFSLPSSFPIHVACFLLATPEYALCYFDARANFICRVARIGSLASLSAMSLDRSILYSMGVGWNHEFRAAMRDYIDISEVDLLDETEMGETRSKLVDALRRHRVRQFQDAATDFLMDFFPDANMPREFSSFLGHLPYESVRILLIFFANQFQFTYLRSTNVACPFCQGNISSIHFFECPQTPPPYNDWHSLVQEFRDRRYWEAVDRIFLTLQRWSSVCRNVAWAFADKVLFYFQYTESQVVRRNSILLAHQMQNLAA